MDKPSDRQSMLIMALLDIVYILIAAFVVSVVDIMNIDLYSWISSLRESGLLGMYNNIDSIGNFSSVEINYPPIYPSYLWLIKDFVSSDLNSLDIMAMREIVSSPSTQIMMKSFSIITFIIAQIILYRVVSPKIALMWTVNVPLVLLTFVWGQRDAFFCFLIIMMLYEMEHHHKYSPSIIFALLCLLKPQGAYLILILSIYLISEQFSTKEKIMSLASGAVLGLIAFAPFMIHQKDILLPFKLYLGEEEWELNYGTPLLAIFTGRC